ncbi:MAG: alternative ribosome rescue aminoacyl-tRNA hydrolase ArfB [Aeoliella sp.]
MVEYLVINDHIRIPRSDLKFTFSRSPGPGGQNVNKVNSKATLHWACGASVHLPEEVRLRMAELFAKRINDRGQLVLSSSTHRTQRRNVDECLTKLRQLVLAATVVPRIRKRFRKSAAATAKRLKNKRAKSERKQQRRPPRMDD